MVEQLTREKLAEQAVIHSHAPVLRRNAPVDRTFELPTGLYGAFVALLFGFLAVMGTGFAHPEMIIPMAIFTIFIAGMFGVPALWARMQPENPVKALTWGRFRAEGIDTLYGRLDARQATVQVLILPVLIFLWGVAVVAIKAIVA